MSTKMNRLASAFVMVDDFQLFNIIHSTKASHPEFLYMIFGHILFMLGFKLLI